ncbi:MAG: histidinol dehydrogenase [Candidatus Sumerlaeota bacterium]|nr:histidinol dehydrogenase [Candidatus Sumerlaeota bacterium]
MRFSKESLERLGEATVAMADAEGLFAHARAVRERLK